MSKFSHIIKISVFTLGLAVFGLAPAAQAVAGQGYNKHNNKHSYKKHYNNHNYNRRNNRRNHNKYSYNRRNNNNHYYGRNYYNRHRGGHGGEVALGLLTGGLLFYALTANQRKSETVYVQQQQPVYVQPTQQQWAQQRPTQPVNNSCLQVREYQTTITVGGQTVPAYGQSCLQADGSWKLGPAIPEPAY